MKNEGNFYITFLKRTNHLPEIETKKTTDKGRAHMSQENKQKYQEMFNLPLNKGTAIIIPQKYHFL